jgi:hypothetical protein
MEKIIFESKLLPDGHLYCPEDLTQKKTFGLKSSRHIKKIKLKRLTGILN